MAVVYNGLKYHKCLRRYAVLSYIEMHLRGHVGGFDDQDNEERGTGYDGVDEGDRIG